MMRMDVKIVIKMLYWYIGAKSLVAIHAAGQISVTLSLPSGKNKC